MLAEEARNRRMRYGILLSADEDGVFTAECPSLPGCVSQGATRDLALENIRDAIKGYLESLKKHGDPIPPSLKSLRSTSEQTSPHFVKHIIAVTPRENRKGKRQSRR
jgi:predicted RNase H-like HicB family nuclease